MLRAVLLVSCVAPLLLACPSDKDMSTDTQAGTDSTGGATGGSETAAPTSTGAPVEDCAFLVGKTFLSDEALECGLGPNGVELCTWKISFTADMFSHMLSDFAEQGTYTCDGGQISAITNGDVQRSGTIDADTGALVWETIVYHVAP